MSLSLENNKNVFAYIKNKDNKKVGEISYNEKENQGIDSISLEDNFKFQLCPRPLNEKERMTLFVAGESGAGKSYFIREYSKLYKKMFPKNQIYLISYLDRDETIDEYKVIKRINAFTESFLNECLDIDLEAEFKNSFVIFDDIDSIINKKTKLKIYGLLNKMLRIGRHFNISVAYVGHELYSSHELKSILNESMSITLFPKFLNYKKLRYMFEVYFGLSKEQIKKIREIKDRSLTYIKGSDKIILSETECFILKNDF
jgi:hypothetical protein